LAVCDKQLADNSGLLPAGDGHGSPHSWIARGEKANQIEDIAQVRVCRQVAVLAYSADRRGGIALELSEGFLENVWLVTFNLDAIEMLLESDILRPLAEESVGDEIKHTKPAVFGPGIGEPGQVALRYEVMIFCHLRHRYRQFSHFQVRGSGGSRQFARLDCREME
jgi:hypothetical protein